MCGGVYEDELKDEADAITAQQPITEAPKSPPKLAEDDGIIIQEVIHKNEKTRSCSR